VAIEVDPGEKDWKELSFWEKEKEKEKDCWVEELGAW
jgi:hypothetical protein